MKLSTIKDKVYDIVTSKKGQKKAITAESLGGLLNDMCDYATTADDITAKKITATAITAATISATAITAATIKSTNKITAATVVADELGGDAINQFPLKTDLDTSINSDIEAIKHIKSWIATFKDSEETDVVCFNYDKENEIRIMYDEAINRSITYTDFRDDVYKITKNDNYNYYDTDCGQIEFCDFEQNDATLCIVVATDPNEEGTYKEIYITPTDIDTLGLDIEVILSFDGRRICAIKYDKVNIRFISFLEK